MASHVIDTSTDSASSSVSGWTEMKHHFAAWRQQRAKQARMIRELASYTDRDLFDLGVTRADIPAIIAGTYRR